jgi:hypothetical protein
MTDGWLHSRLQVQNRAQDFRDLVGIQLTDGREVGLAVDDWVRWQIIQNLAQLHLQKTSLFFNNNNSFQTFCEVFDELGFQRERHPHFADPDAVLNLQVAESLHQVVVGLAGAQDAETRASSVVPIHAV